MSRNTPTRTVASPAPDIPIADPFATLAYAAACTRPIRLGTSICLVPEHNPLTLAKTVATVDRLSGSRLIFGVGVGWLAEEFQALGIPFERRGARTREYIEVMRKLWTEPTSSHSGEFVTFEGVTSYPKPAKTEAGAGMVRRGERRRFAAGSGIRRRLDRLQGLAG
jgi:probable F420-dependent oxidoreductase